MTSLQCLGQLRDPASFLPENQPLKTIGFTNKGVYEEHAFNSQGRIVIYLFRPPISDKQKLSAGDEMTHLLDKMNDTIGHKGLYYVVYADIARDPAPLFSSNERAAIVWVPSIAQSDFKLFKIKDEDLPLAVCYDKTGKLCGFAKTVEALKKLSCLDLGTISKPDKQDKASGIRKENTEENKAKVVDSKIVHRNPCDKLPLKNMWWKTGGTMKDTKIHSMDVLILGDTARTMLYLFSNGSGSIAEKNLYKICQSLAPDHARAPGRYYFVYASFGSNLQPVNQSAMNWSRLNAKSVQASSFKNSNIDPSDFPYVAVYNKDSTLCGCAKTPEELLSLTCISGHKQKGISGKLMSDNNKQRRVIAGADVFLLNAVSNDTVAHTRSNADGDFSMSTGNVTENVILSVKKQNNVDNMILATRQGVEIGRFTAMGNSFEYKLLKPEMSVLTNDETDIDTQLKQLQPGTKQNTVIQQIAYGLNEYKPNAAAKQTLDKVYNYLLLYEDLKLDVVSYTDAQGTEEDNQILSQKRAQAVLDYLVAKGIDKLRLKAIGKGESYIINHCVDGIPCSDSEHAVNRRTEFRFLKK
ncbi:MAG: OmpA family protein [Bacteroidetes bacterium]|nr:OmpA family protein [Bacteroidota bacterium]